MWGRGPFPLFQLLSHDSPSNGIGILIVSSTSSSIFDLSNGLVCWHLCLLSCCLYVFSNTIGSCLHEAEIRRRLALQVMQCDRSIALVLCCWFAYSQATMTMDLGSHSHDRHKVCPQALMSAWELHTWVTLPAGWGLAANLVMSLATCTLNSSEVTVPSALLFLHFVSAGPPHTALKIGGCRQSLCWAGVLLQGFHLVAVSPSCRADPSLRRRREDV